MVTNMQQQGYPLTGDTTIIITNETLAETTTPAPNYFLYASVFVIAALATIGIAMAIWDG